MLRACEGKGIRNPICCWRECALAKSISMESSEASASSSEVITIGF